MTSTNKPKGIVLFLILFSTALGITLANATTEDNYKNETNLLPRIYESTHTENGYKTNIIINPHTTGIYATENDYNLDLTINPKGIGGKLTENNYQIDLIPEKTFPYIPDLAVTNVIPSKTIVGQGYNIYIKVTIKNKGFYFETFNIIAHANTTLVDTPLIITLTSKRSTNITFTWNTTGVPYGNYTISAYAPVPGETNTADNTHTDGTIIVSIPGDVRPEFGTVDISDLDYVALGYGSEKGEPPPLGAQPYEAIADINGDDIIDIFDIFIIGIHYGETYP